MEIKRFDNYRENATRMRNLGHWLPQYVLSLDIFLKALQRDKPEIYEKYLKSLENKMRSLLEEEVVNLKSIKVPGIQETIQDYDEFRKIYFTYVLQLLKLPNGYSEENADISWFDFDKSRIYPLYYRGLVLCEIIGRRDAFEYLKAYTDRRYYEVIQLQLEHEDLDTIDLDIEAENPMPSNGFLFRFHKGKRGMRVDKCEVHEIMKPMEDSELSYIVACRKDIAETNARNPNMYMTRSTSLLLGGPYCDSCFHDTRHVEIIVHPPEEFFQNLGSKDKK